MLMMHHAGRNVNGVALVPVIALAADLRIAVAFKRIEISLGVRVTVALGVR
jgi:hypothetical protein